MLTTLQFTPSNMPKVCLAIILSNRSRVLPSYKVVRNLKVDCMLDRLLEITAVFVFIFNFKLMFVVLHVTFTYLEEEVLVVSVFTSFNISIRPNG